MTMRKGLEMPAWLPAAGVGILIALIVGSIVAKREKDGEAALVVGLIAGAIAAGLVMAAEHYLLT